MIQQAQVTTSPPPQNGQSSDVLERNIQVLIQRRKEEERNRTLDQVIADGITAFAGSMISVYIHAAAFGAWIIINLGWTPIEPFDPTFVALAMIASVEAIFLTTFVLISQNRMMSASERRSDLDLQISLLAEHEVTQLIGLVTKIGHRLGIEEARDPELQDSAKDVRPEHVLDRMDAHELQAKDSGPSSD